MFVIARKLNQWVHVGPPLGLGGVQVKVVRLRRGLVRLGVIAPPNLPVRRGPELCDEQGVPRRPPGG